MRMKSIAIVLLLLAGCATTGPSDKGTVAVGYYDRGISHLQMKNYEKAIVEFQRSIDTDPKYKMSYYAMGMTYDLMGKYDEAEKYYNESIDIDADFADAYNSLGTVYMKQKKWKEALKCFQKAVSNKLYGTPNIAYVNMGDVYVTLDDYPKAIDAYREAKRYANQDYIIYRLGNALLKAGNAREAVTELQEGVGLSPNNVDMRLALGQAHLKDGNKRSAVAEFRKVVELAPKSEAARIARDYIATVEPNSARTPAIK